MRPGGAAPLSKLIGSLSRRDGPGQLSATVTEEWMQGRTTFGGLSAALALAASRDLLGPAVTMTRPLRSAQVSFVGPTVGDVATSASMIRQGKSMSFVRGEVVGERGALATSASFVFGGALSSRLESSRASDRMLLPTAPAELPPPESCPDFFAGQTRRPAFSAQFESRLARGGKPGTASHATEHFLWVRHQGWADGGGVGGVARDVALLALADVAPPAMLAGLAAPAPCSSVTWLLNMLHPAPTSAADGWWLLRSAAEHLRDGYSSQDMTVYGEGGQLVMSGRQLVAIFT